MLQKVLNTCTCVCTYVCTRVCTRISIKLTFFPRTPKQCSDNEHMFIDNPDSSTVKELYCLFSRIKLKLKSWRQYYRDDERANHPIRAFVVESSAPSENYGIWSSVPDALSTRATDQPASLTLSEQAREILECECGREGDSVGDALAGPPVDGRRSRRDYAPLSLIKKDSAPF